MNFPPALPNHLPSQRPSRMSSAMFRAMGNFHRSVESAPFLPMNFPPKLPNNLPSQRPSQISFGSRNSTEKIKSHRNRDRFATESPATCQIWRDGWQPSLLGPGGLEGGVEPSKVASPGPFCRDRDLSFSGIVVGERLRGNTIRDNKTESL